MDSNQEMYKQKYIKYKKKYLGLKTQIDEIEGGKKKKRSAIVFPSNFCYV